MLANFFFKTEQGAILLGSLIIAGAILINGGALKVSESSDTKPSNEVAQAVAPVVQQPVQPQAAAQPAANIPVSVDISGSPVLGNKDAKLTLVEFSDYECPYCKKSFEEVLPDLKKSYIDTGQVKLVYKNLPLSFHQNAAKEAEAALCAKDQGGDVAYYKYHDQIFTKTTSGGTGISIDQLSTIAEDIGLKVTAFQSCLNSGKAKPQVDKDVVIASKVGASGTPTWFLGKTTSSDTIEGISIEGAQPFSAFKKAIDQQLSNN